MTGARASRPPRHTGWRSRGYLPHFDSPESIQHIVFRLADALPPRAMADVDCSTHSDRPDVISRLLREAHGQRLLSNDRVASIMENALLYFDGDRYRLLAWCIMPSHVHALAEQIHGHELAAVVHAWKSFVAHTVNQHLGRSGALWAPEYYDRFMRDERHLQATRWYIESNPVLAGLCAAPEDWRFSSAFSGARASRPQV